MESIVKEVIEKGLLDGEIIEFKPLSGGTSSQIGLFYMKDGRKIVVKQNDPKVIEAESYLLNFYKEIPLFPKVIYTDPENKYFLYSYIEGKMDVPLQKKHLIELVHHVINHYKPVSFLTWGYIEEPVSSWQDFLMADVEVGKERLSSILSSEDHRLVMSLVRDPTRNLLRSPYLLHGDCGIHNFLFDDEHLSGVIDPTPIMGPPIYDLVFAFCSSAADLKVETILEAASHMKFKVSEEILFEEVIIGLYIRISRSIAYHPNDLPLYLEAWNKWKKILKKEVEIKDGKFI